MTDEFETLNSGMQVKRSFDGKFESVKLSSEQAAAMGRRSHGASKEAGARKILSDRGLDFDNTDEALVTLAEIAASKRSGSVQALRYLDSLTGRSPGLEYAKPAPGEACPVCGYVEQVILDLSPEAVCAVGLLLFDKTDESVYRQVRDWLTEREQERAGHGKSRVNVALQDTQKLQ